MRTPWSVVSDVHDDAPLKLEWIRITHASKLLVLLMFASETTALLRAVLNEVCRELPADETGTRTHVASRILEAASRGETSIEVLKQIGQTALTSFPTMWPQKGSHCVNPAAVVGVASSQETNMDRRYVREKASHRATDPQRRLARGQAIGCLQGSRGRRIRC